MKKIEFFLITFFFCSIIAGLTSSFSADNEPYRNSKKEINKQKTAQENIAQEIMIDSVSELAVIDLSRIQTTQKSTKIDLFTTFLQSLEAFFATILYIFLKTILPNFLRKKKLTFEIRDDKD
jgi:hypothetical protein